MYEPYRLRCSKAPWSGKIDFLLAGRSSGKLHVAKPVTIETMDETGFGHAHIEPTFSLDHEDAQALMDELWVCGLRPSEGAGSAGALAATQRHLEDMRRLVFEKFGSGVTYGGDYEHRS